MRSYETPEGDTRPPQKISLPEGYDGTMLTSEEPPQPAATEPPVTVAKEIKYSPASSPVGEPDATEETFARPGPPPPPPFGLPNLLSIFGKLPMADKFKGLLHGEKGESRPYERQFGTEEILLLAVAAFLFFSKEGDRECALFLLLLLLF